MYVGGNPVNDIDPLGLRALTECEKGLLSPYIPKVDLDSADLHDGEVPGYLRDEYAGITRGNNIYFRPGIYNTKSPDGLALLAHELTHVGQYREGMSWIGYLWSTRNGYKESKYEKPAFASENRVLNDLINGGYENPSGDCGCAK